jgi:hypothetical protein
MTPPDEYPDNWEDHIGDPGDPDDADDLDIDDHVGPDIAAQPEHAATGEERVVAIRRLPAQFWDTRALFKHIREAAWATQTHPDAVLAAVLCRAAGMIPHGVKFDSGRGPWGSCNLFACLLAGTGIGKSAAARTAEQLIDPPAYLVDYPITSNTVGVVEPFKDGVGIGSGEGLAEIYMGWEKVETGKLNPKTGLPITIKVRRQVRHNAYFYVDEGETINKLMKERLGATLGPALRTAWTGDTLGQANARDETTRMVKGGTYSMGILIGFQPDVAIDMLTDVGPGTPQRFLWFGAQDTEMPDDTTPWPGKWHLPVTKEKVVIEFPAEIRDALHRHTYDKHHGTVVVDPLDSHEPLMRSKLAALLCIIDGRQTVTREDWSLAGMIWATSCSIRDGLLDFRARKLAQQAEQKLKAKVDETRAVAITQAEVSADIDRVARKIAKKVHAESEVIRYLYRKQIGRDKPLFDSALSHAHAMAWVYIDDENRVLTPGNSCPA